MTIHRICIFCGSSPGNTPDFSKSAAQLGHLLATRHIMLVYGGADVGLMGTMADACLSAGGKVIGVMPEHLVQKEVAHPGLTELRIVDSMHQRKALMCELADGFMALPGGIGTLEETFEMFTWVQLGLHQKPLGLLNIHDFYTPLLDFLAHMVRQGFLKQPHLEMLLTAPTPEALLRKMMTSKTVYLDKWQNAPQPDAATGTAN